MKRDSDDSAVSAVIAVVLMVAITVILAAVIATFLFGMSTNVPKTKIVTATISHVDAKTVIVTYVGGQDATTCTGVRWEISRSTGGAISSFIMGSTSASASNLKTGTVKKFNVNYSGKKRVLATGYFTDGTQQVILDNMI